MSRVAAKIELSPEETDELNRWLKSGKTEQRKVERAKIVLRSAEGKPAHQIAKELGTRPTRVKRSREPALSMSNSCAKRSITSSPHTMNKPLPSNGTKLKSNNSPCAIISLIFACNY